MVNNEHIYVFPQCVNEVGFLKVNIYENRYELIFGDLLTFIEIDRIKKNTSNILLYDKENNSFIFFDDYGSTLKKFNIESSEFLKKINKSAFMQIDFYGSSHFVKIFLPMLQINLLSDTHDFSNYGHFPVEAIHPVDWKYQPTAILHSAIQESDIVSITIESIPSILDDGVYYFYNGIRGKINAGHHNLILPYKPGEVMRIGKHENFDYSYKDVFIDEYL